MAHELRARHSELQCRGACIVEDEHRLAVGMARRRRREASREEERTGQRKKRQAREGAESELASWEQSRPTGSDHGHVAQQANKQGWTTRCIKSKQAASAARPAGPRGRGHEETTSSTATVTSKQTSGERRKEMSRSSQSTCTVNRYKYTFALSSNSLF